MSPPLSPAEIDALAVLALVVLVMARRTYLLSRGTRYSPVRVFGFGAFPLVLFGALAASTIYLAVVAWGPAALGLTAAYGAVILGVAFASAPRVRRTVAFELRPDGRLYYRLPIVVPLLSLLLFLARVAVEVALFGLAAFATFTLPTGVPTDALLVLITTDVLFGASVGLVLGRGSGVYAARRGRGRGATDPSAGASLPAALESGPARREE